MLSRLYIILAMTIAIYGYSNDSSYKHFDIGNEYYALKNYDSALIEYNKVFDSKMISKELYLNIGNCYFKLDSIPQAILYYEKGLKLAPADADLTYNLQYCNQLIKDKNPIKKSVLLNELIFSFLGKSPNYWAYASVLLMTLTCILILLFKISIEPKWKKINFYTAVFVSILFSITILLAYISKTKMNETKYGIVMETSTKVRTEPSENASTAFLLHEGSKAKVTAKINEWLEISFNDKKGWIKRNSLEKI